MYEMEGALSGHATLSRPVARLTRRHAPPARARYPCEVPASRRFPRPGAAPGMMPVSDGERISTASPGVAQEYAAIQFRFLLYPHNVHRTSAVIRTWRRLSNGLCTTH